MDEIILLYVQHIQTFREYSAAIITEGARWELYEMVAQALMYIKD